LDFKQRKTKTQIYTDRGWRINLSQGFNRRGERRDRGKGSTQGRKQTTVMEVNNFLVRKKEGGGVVRGARNIAARPLSYAASQRSSWTLKEL